MTYADYEHTVYDYLLQLQREAPDWRFATRRKQRSGAGGDRFIGTERSGYFATTFWTIPLSYPGAAGDLIGLYFTLTGEGYSYRWEIAIDRQATGGGVQYLGALALAKQLRQLRDGRWRRATSSPADQRSERTTLPGRQRAYASVDDLLRDVRKDLEEVLPDVDESILAVREKYPDFEAHRITEQEFTAMQERLTRRLSDQRTEVADLSEAVGDPASRYSAARNPHSQPLAIPLNQIFYGPPGTGKTYATVAEAVRIANPAFAVTERSRIEVRREYERLREEGRIVFTTFHQSMSYEDFVEGIRPVIGETTPLAYRVVPGVFRRLVDEALKNERAALNPRTRNGLHLDKQLIRKATAYQLRAPEPLDERIWLDGGYIEAPTAVEGLRSGDLVLLRSDVYTIRAVGSISGPPTTEAEGSVPQRWPVDWLYRDLSYSAVRVYGAPFDEQPFQRLDSARLRRGLLREYDHRPAADHYVLIIDELNRGDVSRIFGELITLLEPERRLGAAEATTAVLPYSRETFGVPANVYLIATMNSADRGTVALDTALRRRFHFRRFGPRPDLLAGRVVGGFDLAELLSLLNDRMLQLLGPDQLIGHAYLLEVHRPEDLRDAFALQLVPQLEASCFGDLEKVRQVLGQGFFSSSPDRTLAPGTVVGYEDSPLLYQLRDIAGMSEADFLTALSGIR